MQDCMSPSSIIVAWETGAARRPLDQALAVLWAATGQDATDWPLVSRDQRLLALKAATFGPQLPVRTKCPECDADLEAELDANVLAAGLADAKAVLRPMTSRDLAAVSGLPAEQVVNALCERIASDRTDLEDIVKTIEADAAATEISVKMSCDDCAAEWAETLDVAAYVWAELHRAAHGLLSDVGVLAAAYGWTEAEVLALSPMRRRAYLALAGAA